MTVGRRRTGSRTGGALFASLLLHGAAVSALALSGGAPEIRPKTKVYAVDIVSPPPNLPGPPMAAAPSNQEPGPAAPAPAAEPNPPAPAAEPEPPAPDPAPPKAEAPKEPAKAPEPRRTAPERLAQPAAQRPAATNTPPAASNRPSTPAPRPPTPVTRPSTPATRPGSAAQTGTGSGPNRTRGERTTNAPATGRNPDAASPGGEGLTIYSPGDPCPVAGYCDNVSRQIARYFRPPAGSSATGVVCFRLHRDGSVTDIEVERIRRGSAAIRLSMMEAAEAAGSRRAFGALPSAFPSGGRWCIELAPS
jgi:hypothetical protein